MDKYVAKTRIRKHASFHQLLNLSDNAANVIHSDAASSYDQMIPCSTKWRNLTAENLECDYTVLLSKQEADAVLSRCEEEIVYNTGDLSRVKIFGQWRDIPRKQAAFGDPGLSYKFSGNTIPAKPWPDFLKEIRNKVESLTGQTVNFVLINRYKDGNDHISEHRDDEKDLDPSAPIVSLSLGQPRDFVFKHCDCRGPGASKRLAPLKLTLEHGSLLVMRPPTNQYWYHSLPPRKNCTGVRVNMTFRRLIRNGKVKKLDS